MEKYVYFESVVNKLYIELNTNVKISLAQNKQYEKCALFSFMSSNSSQFYF